MRNLFKKALCLLLCVMCIFAVSACRRDNPQGGFGGTGDDEKIDKNKTQIYVSGFNGGYGLDWLRSVKADFEKDYPQYQIMISAEKYEMKTLSETISSKTGTYNIYITSGSQYVKELIDLDCLVDLSDVFNNKAAENESKTIKDKMYDSATHKAVYSKRDGTGIYTFPYTKGFTGIVFDMDTFIENNWIEFAKEDKDGAALSTQGISYSKEGNKLVFQSSTGITNYEQGDYILTAGRDGKYGTYDDGQPVTEYDFSLMLAKIQASGIYNPFVYSTAQSDYVNNVISSVFATYEGIDNYKLFYSFDGTYSRTGEVITPETGYNVYNMAGFEKSGQFAYDYISRKGSIASVMENDVTYTEAQNNFVLGHQIADTKNKAGAMLIDGIWWENEAKATMDVLGKTESERAYGKRDYRVLVYPEIEGAYGLDGKGKGTIYTAYEEGLIFIDKNKTDASLVDACKEFVKYTCRDKYLIEAAKVACIRPFEFDATSTYGAMTKFVRNINEMFADTENIKVLSTYAYKNSSDLSFYGLTAENLRWATYPALAFRQNNNLSVSGWLTDEKNYYKNNWNSYIDKMNFALGN